MAYYGWSSLPSLMFDGTLEIVGASTSDATGVRYANIIQGGALEPAPIQIVIDSFDTGTGSVSATVTMHSETATATGDFNFILTEDNVDGANYNTEVTRLYYTEPISLTGAGNTAIFTTSFAIDPTWNTANLHVIAFVQQADKEMLQVASTYPQPLYKARAMVPFSRNIIGPSSGTNLSGDFTVINVGMAETFDVNLVVDHAPAGWTVEYCDAADNCYSTQTVLSLVTDESADYYLKVMPTSPGYMLVSLEVTSAQAGTLEVPFTYFTDDIDVLMVDSDGGETFEDYFTAALDAAGMSYGVWDLAASKTNPEVTATYSVLVWSTGPGVLDDDDRAFLRDYLDQGNNLFITGQDIGWGLAYAPGSGYDLPFLHDYLHANYLRDDTNLYDLDGVVGDPVSGGIDLTIQGGDGANNQEYPDEISPYDGDAVEIYRYVGDGVGAIRSVDSTSGSKVVYLGFGYEAINNAADRAAALDAAIGWLMGRIFNDGFESGDFSGWSGVIQ